jgi:RNA polymerase-binding transcription factor DksA
MDAASQQGGAMVDSKDRLGKRLQEKEKGEEDIYYQERDREAIERLKRDRVMGVESSARGHCPRCGATLQPVRLRGVTVLQCPVDCGTWLAKGELEIVAQREHNSWLGRLFYGPKLDK